MKTFCAKQGFTLIETLIAMLVLELAAAGALAGLSYSAVDLRAGAIRQYQMVLLEAKAQRILTQDKSNFAATAVTAGYPVTTTASASYPPNMVVGSWPAQVGAATQGYDPTPVVGGDLSTGAYFTVLANGRITALSSTSVPPVPTGTKCGDTANLPGGSYCRETLLTIGPPVAFSGGGANILPAGSTAMTLWTRISKVGAPLSAAVWHRETIIQ